jgi:hypothetical protein
VQHSARAISRLAVVAAIALVAAAIAVFAWLSSGDVAGAATTGGSTVTRPVQENTPDGDCPEHRQGGSGGSGEQSAPSGSSDTQL